mmetsp:Transcript_24433/g.48966  ORF Transcript_24433/g.48966 Transcript_24433/m.48966 type:complete len:355 (-) Transcript_24433:322-1386(-)
MMTTKSQEQQSNTGSNKKYLWKTHQVPSLLEPVNITDDRNGRLWNLREGGESIPPPRQTYIIRSLKQGSTGATKTWPAAEVLLDYLVRRGGMRDVEDKIPGRGDLENEIELGALDLTLPPGNFSEHPGNQGLGFQNNVQSGYNIVEIGAGTGCLGVGLSMALNRHDNTDDLCGKGKMQSSAKLLCTDIDKATIKNMRFNVSEQPRGNGVSKNVGIEPLGWADDVGGDKFSMAVERQFQGRGTETMQNSEDPLRLVTHLIGSDVHFGCHTLEPLSSVVSAFKLRNPDVNVVVLIRERNPDAYADVKELASTIIKKVKHGLERDENKKMQSVLNRFTVSVRNVLHDEVMNMKLMEC